MTNSKTITILIIVLFNYYQLIQSDNCSSCEPRSVMKKTEVGNNNCMCNDDYFCNLQNKSCVKCGNCYDLWKTKTNSTKFDISDLITTIISSYNVDIVKLETISSMISNRFDQNDDIIINITTSINIVDNYIRQIINEMGNIKQRLLKIEEMIQSVDGNPSKPEFSFELIQDFNKQISEIFNKIQGVNVNSNWDKQVDIFKTNLGNVQAFIGKFQQLPIIHETYEFIRNFDDELNFLESRLFNLSKIDGTPTFVNYKQIMETIDKDVEKLKTIVIDLINHLLNIYRYVGDVEELVEKSGNIRKSGKNSKLQLEQLLEKDVKFLQHLELIKKEKLYLARIKKQQNNLERIGNFTNALNLKIDNFRMFLNQTDNEIETNRTRIINKYQQYTNKQIPINNQINKIENIEHELNRLSVDLLVENETILQLEDKFVTVANLEGEIDKLRATLDSYIDEILKYCRMKDGKLRK